MLEKQVARIVTRELKISAKQKANKAVVAGGVYFGSPPRNELKPEVESPSRQSLQIPRTEGRTPRTSSPTDVPDSEMEGREENVETRAIDDMSSEYDPTTCLIRAGCKMQRKLERMKLMIPMRLSSFHRRHLDGRGGETIR